MENQHGFCRGVRLSTDAKLGSKAYDMIPYNGEPVEGDRMQTFLMWRNYAFSMLQPGSQAAVQAAPGGGGNFTGDHGPE